jgi:hypothetical protein
MTEAVILAAVTNLGGFTADDDAKFSATQSAIHEVTEQVGAALRRSVQAAECRLYSLSFIC